MKQKIWLQLGFFKLMFAKQSMFVWMWLELMFVDICEADVTATDDCEAEDVAATDVSEDGAADESCICCTFRYYSCPECKK